MLRRRLSSVLLLLLVMILGTPPAGALAAAATPGYQSTGANAGGSLPLRVPYVAQLAGGSGLAWRVAEYACGPASAAMVAAYWSGSAPPFGRAALAMGGAALIGVGSEPWQVAQAIRLLAPGVAADTASARDGTVALSLLRAQLNQGRPVIALVHPSWFLTPINHFVVVTDLAPARHLVIFHDPLMGADVQESEQEFLAAWAHPRQGRPYTYVWAAGGRASLPAPSPTLPAASAATLDVPPGNGASPDTALAVGDQVTVTPSGLRVHAAPSVNDTVVAYLAHGDQAQIIAVSGGWVRLRLDGQTLGWVNGGFVLPS